MLSGCATVSALHRLLLLLLHSGSPHWSFLVYFDIWDWSGCGHLNKPVAGSAVSRCLYI